MQKKWLRKWFVLLDLIELARCSDPLSVVLMSKEIIHYVAIHFMVAEFTCRREQHPLDTIMADLAEDVRALSRFMLLNCHCAEKNVKRTRMCAAESCSDVDLRVVNNNILHAF